MLNRDFIVKRYGTKTGLVEIVCSNSQLSAIDITESDLFTEHRHTLELVDLSSNHLELIEVNIFKGLGVLKEARLSYNRLAYLNSELFKDTTHLERLFLNGNKIGSIEPKIFAKCAHLVELDLSFNGLCSISEKLFQGCVSLVSLRLDNNHIVYVHQHAFERLANLTTLRLSNNSIRHLHKITFRKCINLKDLYLNGNNLNEIDHQLFCHLRHLVKLDLSKNDLSSLEERTFDKCDRLEELGLLKTKITTVSPALFVHCKHLKQIWLDTAKIPLIDQAHIPVSLLKRIIFRNFETNELMRFNSQNDLVSYQMNDNDDQNYEENLAGSHDRLNVSHSSNNMTLNATKKEKNDVLFETENYQALELVGFGKLSTVYLVQDNTDSINKVIKRYSSRSFDTIIGKSLLREIKLLKQLNHEFILQYYDYFYQKQYFCVVMEYFPGKQTLEEVFHAQKHKHKNFNFRQIYDWMRHMIEAIDYLHNVEAIMHLNCNPKSFFVDKNHTLKLGEFSRAIRESDVHDEWNFVDNPSYMSPELIEHRGCSFKCDIWSVGCVIFEMIELKRPYKGLTFYEICQSIATDELVFKRENISDSLKSLVHLMMEKEPSKRINSIELLEKFSDFLAEKQSDSKRSSLMADEGAKSRSGSPTNKDLEDSLTKSLGISRDEIELSKALEKVHIKRKVDLHSLFNFTARPEYQTLDRLGSGSFGIVYLVLDHHDQKLKAVKKLFSPSQLSTPVVPLSLVTQNELDLLKKLDSPYIIKYLDDFIQSDCTCIVMEYCEKKDLDVLIVRQANKGKKFPIKQVFEWIKQILTAVEYLHSKSIIHRDIKPRNIFVTESSNLKLGDLGTAKMIDTIPKSLHDTVGTWNYLSPEIIKGTGYLHKTDVWSTGCVIFELIKLKKAFDGNNLYQLMTSISERDLDISHDEDFTKLNFMAPLLETMLKKDAKDRVSSKDALDRFMVIYDICCAEDDQE